MSEDHSAPLKAGRHINIEIDLPNRFVVFSEVAVGGVIMVNPVKLVVGLSVIMEIALTCAQRLCELPALPLLPKTLTNGDSHASG